MERGPLLLVVALREQVGEAIGGDDAVGLDGEHGEHEPLAGRPRSTSRPSCSSRSPPNIRNSIPTDGRRCHAGGMANKVPEKHNAKKPGKSLKEKRADKQKKKTERRSG